MYPPTCVGKNLPPGARGSPGGGSIRSMVLSGPRNFARGESGYGLEILVILKSTKTLASEWY